MKSFILSIAFLAIFSSIAEAKIRRGRLYYHKPVVTNNNYTTNSSEKVYSYTNSVSMGSDQQRCQAEADYMARNNIAGHVWGTIGSFEGVGYGSSPNCRTCTPSSPMTCTGDACAQGRNGMWYRVRSWR